MHAERLAAPVSACLRDNGQAPVPKSARIAGLPVRLKDALGFYPRLKNYIR